MVDKYTLLEKSPQLSERIFGLKFDTLQTVLKKVQLLYHEKLEANPLSKRGLVAEFSFENQFLLTLEYLRSYQTFDVLSFSYGISKSYAYVCYKKILGLLSETFALNNKKISFKTIKKVLVDVTCQPIERPGKEQEQYYNSYKKTTFQKYN